MFCKYCGKEINENAIICEHCGTRVEDKELKNLQKVLPEDWEKSWDWANFLGLIGFAVYIPFIGTLIGIIVGLANLWKPGIRKRQAIFLLIVAIIFGLFQFFYFFHHDKFLNDNILSRLILALIIVIVPVVGIPVVSLYWEKKGLKWWRGFVVSILFPYFWIFVFLVCALNLVVLKRMIEKKLKKGELKKCLFCSKLITHDAKFCRYCGRKQGQPLNVEKEF